MLRFALVLLVLSAPTAAQAEGLHPALIQRAPLAPDLASLPRLAGTDAVAQKINAVLQGEDDKSLDTRQGCLEEPNSDFSGWSEVTLNSPEFLSILQGSEFYCNTDHGWNFQNALLFDLITGKAIDPVTLLPYALRPIPEDDNTPFSIELSLARNKPLTDLYLSRLAVTPPNELAELNHQYCPEILTKELHHFQIWPDAKARALMLMPVGMAYVFTPCQYPVAIPVGLLLKLRASPRLIAALAQ